MAIQKVIFSIPWETKSSLCSIRNILYIFFIRYWTSNPRTFQLKFLLFERLSAGHPQDTTSTPAFFICGSPPLPLIQITYDKKSTYWFYRHEKICFWIFSWGLEFLLFSLAVDLKVVKFDLPRHVLSQICFITQLSNEWKQHTNI